MNSKHYSELDPCLRLAWVGGVIADYHYLNWLGDQAYT